MNIYLILSSKSHDTRYLKRYITFISKCQQNNKSLDTFVYIENHHICPKAKDMFPEYSNLKKHKWNSAKLTARQHFIAHIMLCKLYPQITSQSLALERMYHSKQNFGKLSSKQYENLKLRNIEERRILSSNSNLDKLEKGIHHFQRPGMRKRINETRVKNGTHHFVGGSLQKQNNIDRVKNGSHQFLDGRIAKENNKRRIEDGTHNWLEEGYQSKVAKKRIENGSHPFVGIVNCIDKEGNSIKIKKEIYAAQNKDDMEFVFHGSHEGKRRKRMQN